MGREVRWVVRPGDGATLGEVLARAFGESSAIREGRVFVGRVRATDPDAPVALGDIVTVGTAREPGGSVRILAVEDGVVAADKPAGMPTIPDQGGSSHSLLFVLAKTLGCPPRELHPTSRLDREVSGVVLFARTPAAAARLAEARASGAYFRRYVAVATRVPARSGSGKPGEWTAPIGRASNPKKRAAFGRDATYATTFYETVATAGTSALLVLEPVTGRTHQLRVHAAHAAAPLLGDRDYGGATRVVLPSGRVVGIRRVALHAARVRVEWPKAAAFEVRSPVPSELRELWTELGGNDAAWDAAIDAPVVGRPGPEAG
jgi:23S rRNA pseudouridine1911/1915/1917 synthase